MNAYDTITAPGIGTMKIDEIIGTFVGLLCFIIFLASAGFLIR